MEGSGHGQTYIMAMNKIYVEVSLTRLKSESSDASAVKKKGFLNKCVKAETSHQSEKFNSKRFTIDGKVARKHA